MKQYFHVKPWTGSSKAHCGSPLAGTTLTVTFAATLGLAQGCIADFLAAIKQ